ncbi:hypothetical protein D9757_004531 [Collybiopsis confluens]|uniref:Uncharacterized protein n=1 Tax=Collybiopsis confluens TaxID=2823264 RepID=A0A8H5HWZ4_9AGAR|nr:hypothetical protein D9757_004531 [Collybiopsis confluens]
MSELPPEYPASTYGLAHPDYALLKTSVDSELNVYDSPQWLDGSIPVRSSVRGGYMQILSLFILAVLIACMNHLMFAHLDGKEPGSHTSQFWITVLKNAFPAAVAFLLFMGLKICLSQVALYHMQLDSHSLELVNLITSPPSLLNMSTILFKSSMRTSLLCFALLAASITQAVALTSLFVPGTLSVAPAPSRIQTLEVPIIDFSAVNPIQSSLFENETTHTTSLSFFEPSQRWRQIVFRAATSDSTPTWNPPAGCGSACSYSFTYVAPALNCTDLSKEDIWPSGANTSDSHLIFSQYGVLYGVPSVNNPLSTTYAFYNSSFIYHSDAISYAHLDVLYMENFTTTSFSAAFDNFDPEQWSPRGVRCIYQNATYEAMTKFSNNTQVSSTHIKEWHNSLNSAFPSPQPYISYTETQTGNAMMAIVSITQTFNELFQGDALYTQSNSSNGTGFSTSGTEALYTPLFTMDNSPGADGSSINSLNFSLSPMLDGNLSAGLQGLFGDVILAFINEQMATTHAEATVKPETTEYQYTGWRLGLIYGIVFTFSLVVIAYGLFCLRKNGTLAIFDLLHILEMTATSTRLHESVAHAEFGSALVRGEFSTELNGARRRIVVLEVTD